MVKEHGKSVMEAIYLLPNYYKILLRTIVKGILNFSVKLLIKMSTCLKRINLGYYSASVTKNSKNGLKSYIFPDTVRQSLIILDFWEGQEIKSRGTQSKSHAI